MVANGEFGEVQSRCDLLVGQTLRHERDKLLLTQGEIRLRATLASGLSRREGDETKERAAKPGRTNRFAARDGANGRDDIARGCVLKEITHNSRAHRGDELR